MPREAPPQQVDTPSTADARHGDELLELEATLATTQPAPRHWPATASPWASALVELRLDRCLAA